MASLNKKPGESAQAPHPAVRGRQNVRSRCGVGLCRISCCHGRSHSGIETDTFADATVRADCGCDARQCPIWSIENPERRITRRAEARRAKITIARSNDCSPERTRTARPDDASAAAGEARRRSIRPSRPLASPPRRRSRSVLPPCRIAGGDVLTKWSGVEADIRAENEILARCRDRRPNDLSGGGAKLPRHRRARPRANRPRPHRRDQPRDQSGDRADERSRAVGRARPLERAARNVRAPAAAIARITPSPNMSR